MCRRICGDKAMSSCTLGRGVASTRSTIVFILGCADRGVKGEKKHRHDMPDVAQSNQSMDNLNTAYSGWGSPEATQEYA